MADSCRSGAFQFKRPGLIVHGGAWDIPDDALPEHRDGLRTAIDEGRRRLEAGVEAVAVVTETVAAMEAHGAFDAGCGAMLNRDGCVQLDAGVMDGATSRYGSVMAVEHLRHPVRVARCLLERGDRQVCMLAGDGAERFAERQGFERIANDELICDRERERYARRRAEEHEQHPSESFRSGHRAADLGHDTVGCVALDHEGRLAAATSTGGTPFKLPGRVGDSPIPGAGFYATDHVAVSSTGWGEAIAAVVLAHSVARDVEAGADPEAAATKHLKAMHTRIRDPEGDGACAGLIVLDRHGRGAWAHTTPRMARSTWHTEGSVWLDV
jgi:beta-aspartyl-peptidase (threonine type)